MKLTALFVLFTTGIAVSGYSQTFLGVKGGLTAARISYSPDPGDTYIEFQTRTAPHFGLMVEIPISSRLYFQPELLYVEKGARGKTTLSNVESPHFTQRLQSLALPLLLSVRLGEKLTVAAGPEVAYLLRSRLLVDGKNSGTTGDFSYFEDEKFLLNADLEVGYRLARFQLSLRANLGLQPVAEIDFTDVNGEVVEQVKYHNHALQLALAYRLFGS